MAKFAINGRCGYVLKPQLYTNPQKSFNPFTTLTIDEVVAMNLEVEVISGQVSVHGKCSGLLLVSNQSFFVGGGGCHVSTWAANHASRWWKCRCWA